MVYSFLVCVKHLFLIFSASIFPEYSKFSEDDTVLDTRSKFVITVISGTNFGPRSNS